MRKLFLTAVFMLGFSSLALAAVGIPETHAGIYWSPKEEGINHMETFDVIKFKDLVSLEAGYAGDTDKADHKGIIAVSLDIKQLHLGNYIKFPILDLIEFRPAVIAGLGHINIHDLSGAKFDWGIGASFLSYRF